MIAIVDNGSGAQEIKKFLSDSKIIKPQEIEREEYDAFILTNGQATKENQGPNVELIKNAKRPILGMGLGFLYMGASFGADVVEAKPTGKLMTLKTEHPSPLLNDIKRLNVQDSLPLKLENLPECFEVICEKKNGPEIIQDVELPLIGTRFDISEIRKAKKIFKNFEDFSQTYDFYHKEEK